ncbi:serine hydrolase domain-containing protein [Mucisphaera sp.]|uniref:serine hydrolase domain-containing protein n=1 Tax=Mucisphaera sp. TaxID=2913024 RepID=UPI003D10E911
MTKQQRVWVLRALLFVGTLVSLWFVPWPMVLAWMPPLPATVQEQVDRSLDYGFDGVVVYVDEAGQAPRVFTAGWHDRELAIPARGDAFFKIASISKLYDAVAITKLVSDERISLDDTLASHFPELTGRIEYADRITLRQMVQHRSGIPNFTDAPGFWANPPESAEAALALALDQPALFEPGEGYSYSNTNYFLLSELIKRITGHDKHYFIEERVLDPLGLSSTHGSMHDVDPDDLMSGYYVGFDEDLKANEDGSMVATASDVAVFLRALNDGSVFDEGEQEVYSSIYVYNHTGLIPGYQSIARYHADIDTVVVQFVSTTNFSGYTWGLSELSYDRIIGIVKRSRAD